MILNQVIGLSVLFLLLLILIAGTGTMNKRPK